MRTSRPLAALFFCLGLLGCERAPEPDTPTDLLALYADCWQHQVIDRTSGLVRIETLGVYLPDHGVAAMSGKCPQGFDLRWAIEDYQTDKMLARLNSFLKTDALGPNAAGFRARVTGQFQIDTSHMMRASLVFRVREWEALEPVTPDLSERLWDRFARGEGPI